MDEIILTLDKRDIVGKQVKKLRAEGVVPAVIHDHGKPSVIVSGPYVEMSKAYQKAGRHAPISVQAAGKRYTTLIKSVDIDPKKHQLRHVVFNAVKANEKVAAEVPVRIAFDEDNETTPAERNGLIVLHQLESVEIEALPRNLPEYLEFNGEKLLEAGDSATVADLVIPEGVELKTDLAHTLCTVFEPSALQAANDAAGGTADEEEVEAESAKGEEATEGESAGEAAEGETKSEGAESAESEKKEEK